MLVSDNHCRRTRDSLIYRYFRLRRRRRHLISRRQYFHYRHVYHFVKIKHFGGDFATQSTKQIYACADFGEHESVGILCWQQRAH